MVKHGAKSKAEWGAIRVGGAWVAPGTREGVEIPVARLPIGAEVALRATVVRGSSRGPTVWLSAAIHGDELNGVAIIHSVLRKLDAMTLNGTVIAVPAVNLFGLLNQSRYLPDRRDLNRSFPGNRKGSLASQLAHLFMSEIVEHCDYGIDYHTGSDGRTNLPQIRCDTTDRTTLRLARAFGAPVILHSDIRDGSLRGAATQLNKRVLLYEAGEAHRFCNRAISGGVLGTLRVLARLGMVVDSPARKRVPPVLCRKSNWLRSRRSGFFELDAELGSRVQEHQVLGRIFDLAGESELMVKALFDGIVIGHQSTCLVNRGDALVHVAETPAEVASESTPVAQTPRGGAA